MIGACRAIFMLMVKLCSVYLFARLGNSVMSLKESLINNNIKF